MSFIATTCEQNAIQLMNGQSKFEGCVEVYDNGEWRTVCSDMWDEREATVVCRQLGFTGNINGKYIMFTMFNYRTKDRDIIICKLSASSVVDLRFGDGAGTIIEARWECLGNETNFFNCLRHNISCNHGIAAGVTCFGIKVIALDSCSYIFRKQDNIM